MPTLSAIPPPDADRAQAFAAAIRQWRSDADEAVREPAPPDVQAQSAAPPLGNAELVQLQTRVIALENLVTALLADASIRQLELSTELANLIRPRQGYTQHRLTLHAAEQMMHLLERGKRLRSG
jgi:hypothetical protein